MIHQVHKARRNLYVLDDFSAIICSKSETRGYLKRLTISD